MTRQLTATPSDSLGVSLFDGRAGHRASPRFHQSAAMVDITAIDLGDVPQWPLLLDECVRLLEGTGIIRFRLTERLIAEKHEVARVVASLSTTPVRLRESSHDAATQTLAVEVTRRPVDATMSDFTFGVVSDGRNIDRLVELIASVRAINMPAGVRREIIVCGPGRVLGDADLGRDITIADEDSRFAAIPWITGKKNRIVQASSCPNVIIAHDRYRFPPDFLENLIAWGGDYSLLTPRAILPSGARFPDWHALEGPGHEIRFPIGLLDYADYHPGVYANGGLIIAKHDTLIAHPLSEMLCWGEAEDVEFSRRLNANGHLLRLAPQITVESIETTPGYVAAFTPLRPQPGDRPCWQTQRLVRIGAGNRAPHTIAGTAAVMQRRTARWAVEPNRLRVEIPSSIGATASVHLAILAHACPQPPSVVVDDMLTPSTSTWFEDQHLLEVTFRIKPEGSLTSVSVTGHGQATIALGHLTEVSDPEGTEVGAVHLGAGWWPREQWGAWAQGHTAEILVRGNSPTAHALTLRAPPSFADAASFGVMVNGRHLGTFTVGPSNATVDLQLNGTADDEDYWHLVSLLPSALVPVAVENGPPDARLLGPGLEMIPPLNPNGNGEPGNGGAR